MMDELVFTVDENDMITGTERMYRCHKKGFWHRGTSIIIFKDNNKQDILLQKRPSNAKVCPNKLCLIGGHIKAGFTYEEGAKKEIEEELFNSEFAPHIILKKLFKIKKKTDNDFEFHQVFETTLNHKFNIDKSEVDYCFYENIDKIKHLTKNNSNTFTETTLKILKEYFKTEDF